MIEQDKVGRKFDGDKPRPSLMPSASLLAISRVLTLGSKKYADNNWLWVEGAEKRYKDALWRHLIAYSGGEKIDPETGENHLAHIGCNVMFLLYADETGYKFLEKTDPKLNVENTKE